MQKPGKGLFQNDVILYLTALSQISQPIILSDLLKPLFWIHRFHLICKLSWSQSCRAAFAPRRSCIVSRARLIQISTIRTLCLHRDFVSSTTQLIQILRGTQQEKLLSPLPFKSSNKRVICKEKNSHYNWPSQWVR